MACIAADVARKLGLADVGKLLETAASSASLCARILLTCCQRVPLTLSQAATARRAINGVG